jgi:type VI secretion system protein ImpK
MEDRIYRFDLVKDFWEFYGEVVQFKKQIMTGPGRAAHDLLVAHSAPPVDADVILQRLQAVLERQAMAVGRMGVDSEIVQQRDARYAMAALADDIFLQDIHWAGREVWRNNLLEYRLFRTHIAGERIFEMIDHLLAGRNFRDSDLARIYLLILAMGFKGGLRDRERAGAIHDYSVRLFEFIYNRTPDFREADQGLFPQAYQHNLTGRGSPFRRPGLGRWWSAAVAVIGFLALSEILWLFAVSGTGRAALAALQAASAYR